MGLNAEARVIPKEDGKKWWQKREWIGVGAVSICIPAVDVGRAGWARRLEWSFPVLAFISLPTIGGYESETELLQG